MKAGWCLVTLLAAAPVLAQNPDAYRGGWIADIEGGRQVYLLVVTGKQVTGVACTDCSNPEDVAFVDDGELTGAGVHFRIYHERHGAVAVDEAQGSVENGELVLSRKQAGQAKAIVTRLHRSPFVHVKAAPPGGFEPLKKAYEPPVTPGLVSADKVVGLWLAGTGPGKQYFIFKRHKNEIRGLACGPCSDTANMAVIEHVRMEGDKLHFDIAHEDSGPGIVEHGPHKNVTVATIARNEMHLWVVPSFEPPTFTPVEMTLLGPVNYQGDGK